ncbi:hypothetical protein H3143_00405 [Mycoplasma tullyi]|uniref:Uncharacterized protein n=1 Tax=Mycoplasma tullyi TaxID=1612150 RepID=A0A7D7UAD6_9MOLU|nr:hypothetical protein [Mycoplasma tullyi]QMT98604.1 hypothetical protein H3143_00405 [Mycoplasma tullyi]
MALTTILYLRNCGNNLQRTLDYLKNEKLIVLLDQSVDLTNDIVEKNNLDPSIVHKQKFENLSNALNYLFKENLITTDFYYIFDVRNELDEAFVSVLKQNLVEKKLYFWNLKRYQKVYKPVKLKNLVCENLDFVNTVFYKKDINPLSVSPYSESAYFDLLFQHLDQDGSYQYIKSLTSVSEPELFDAKLRRYKVDLEDQNLEFLNKMIEKNHQEYLWYYFENNLEFVKRIVKRDVQFSIHRKMSYLKGSGWNPLTFFKLNKKYKDLFKLEKQ